MASSAPHLTWDVLNGKMLEIYVGSRRKTWAISRSKLHYLMQDVHRWHRVNRMSLFCLNDLLTLLQHQINVQMFFQFTANHLNVRSELCWVSKRLKGNLQWWFKKKKKEKKMWFRHLAGFSCHFVSSGSCLNCHSHSQVKTEMSLLYL